MIYLTADRLRRQAEKLGLQLVKSRVRNTHSNNQGGFRIIDPSSNTVVTGADFDLDLEAVRDFLAWYGEPL